MKQKTMRLFRSIIGTAVCILGVLTALAVLLDIRLRPVLREYADIQAVTQTGLAVNRAVGETLCRSQNEWLQLFRDTDGRVLSVCVDEHALGKFKAEVAQAVLSALSACERLPVSVPVGSVVGGSLLTGRGPVLYFPVHTACTATVSVQNGFTAAGINQTQHLVTLTIDIDIAVILPDGSLKRSYRQECTVAQTVLLGEIPQVYIGDHSNATLQRILGYADLQ